MILFKRNSFFLFLITCFFCFSRNLCAQGYQANFQGQVNIAMASAGSALPQDASALFYNPGSAAFCQQSGIVFGATGVKANIGFQDASSGTVSRTDSPLSTPFHLYGLYQFGQKKQFTAGLGVYTPFGSTISYEDGWIGRFALKSLELRAIYIQPTFAYKLSENIGIGAGAVYALGSVNLQRDIPVNSNSRAILEGSTSGFGFNAGIFVKTSDKVNMALSYRSRIDMNIEGGDATFNVPSALDANFPDGKFNASLPLPWVYTLGWHIKPTDKWDIVYDINYVGWKAYDSLILDYENNTSSLSDTRSARNYNNTLAFRLGSQYKISEKVVIRGGISYGKSPVPKNFVTPETPDNNRFNYSCGLQYALNQKLKIDASFFFTRVVRKDMNIETNLNGTFKTLAYAPGISLTYNFTKK